MTPFLKKVTLYIVLISVSLLILLMTMAAPILTTGADFSVYNSGWNGCSDLAVSSYEAGTFTPNLRLDNGQSIEVEQKDISSYQVPPRRSTYIFLGPDKEFTSSDADHIHEFMLQGGTVLLADDFGSGGSLLKKLNTTSSFLGKPILDLSFEKKPHFGVAYEISDHPITRNVAFVLTNKPTGITPSEDATVLMKTSSASWLDSNENEIQDQGERQREYPLLTIEDYGDGKLILLSDPSIMINSMNERLDNDILVENMMGFVSDGKDDVIFDESHREVNLVFDLVYSFRYPSRGLSFLVLVLSIGVTAMIFVPSLKKGLFSGVEFILHLFRKEEVQGDIVEKVLSNNPDWDEHKLKTIYRKVEKES